MESKNLYAVILAGGKGERLWPLSRKNRPKQLLPFKSQSSLLENTLQRISSLIPKNRRFIITTTDYADMVTNSISTKVNDIFVEPCSRNTAPAILLACLRIEKKDKNATILFLSADHVIEENNLFIDAVKNVVSFAQKKESLVLFGVKPSFPAIGYGYIEYDNDNKLKIPKKIIKFHEKPNKKTAEFYIHECTMLWNSGMFCGRVSVFIDEYKKYASTLYDQVYRYDEKNFLYEDINGISVDHAIMEKSDKTYVLPVSFSWSDVGDLDTFLSLQNKNQNETHNLISVESQNNIIDVKKKLVALIGVDDLCIIDTDDVLFVARRAEVQKVKSIIRGLKRDYL